MKYFDKLLLRNAKTLLIRSANIEDAVDVLQFLKKVFAETDFLDLSADEFERTQKQQEDIIKFYIASKTSVMLLAIYNNLIVGILTLTGKLNIKMFHRATLGLVVKKSYWGLGIGHALMHSALKFAETTPLIKLELEVVTINDRAVKLYKKFGFSIDGIIKYAKIYNGRIYDHYFMSKLVKEIL